MRLETDRLSGAERYQLLTSLVVPRPIAWISSHSPEGRPNLAPFSYFAALSATPMLVGISIGSRSGAPKDTLRNIRDVGDFCINLATEEQLEAMNESAGEYPPEVNEFEVAGLRFVPAEAVDAPRVADCPVVMECRLFKEVELEGSSSSLVIGEVVRVQMDDRVGLIPNTHFVDTEPLRPVGRLWGSRYALPGETRVLPRPGTG